MNAGAGAASGLRAGAVAVLSLVGTPFLLLVSTSVDVYLRNQIDLDLQVSLLRPYLLGCGLAAVAGALLFALARHAALRPGLWAYYLLGPLFLAYALLRHTALWFVAEPPGLTVLALGGLAGSVRLARAFDPRLAAPLLAALSAAWIAGDAWGFAQRRVVFEPSPAPAARAAVAAPSVYHLLFDEFDSQLFARTLTPEVEHALRGFTWYRAATSTSGKTADSVPAVFAGRVVPTGDTAAWETFNTERSFVFWLRRAGYASHGYLPRLWPFEQRLFDRRRYHVPPPDTDHAAQFRQTWLLAYLPEAAWGWLFTTPGAPGAPAPAAAQQAELAAGRHLAATAPLASLHGLRAAAEQEAHRPASGQYVFAHLLIPHTPYVLRRDCTIAADTAPERAGAGDPVEHARCATAQIVAWVGVLERLGRRDGALIVIHADHGSHLDWSSGEPVWIPPLQRQLPQVRSLLLVKPAGAPRTEPLRVSDAPASLLDVAPTILAASGAHHEMALAGQPLGGGD